MAVVIQLTRLVCIFLSVALVRLLARQRYLRRVMPPGPPGLPLLGNVTRIPKSQWVKFAEWKDMYGPIFSLNLAGQPVVVVNDFTTAADLLDRRSSIYSSRPRLIMASEIFTGGLGMGVMRYCDLWRRMRRATHEGFNARASTAYQPLQHRQAVHLLAHMLADPANWDAHYRRSVAGTVLGAVYGWVAIDSGDDALVKRVNLIMLRILNAALPGAYWVEYFPWMLHLPEWAAPWKRKGRELFRRDSEMLQGLLDDVAAKMDAGTAEPCFVATLLANETKFGLSRLEITWLAGAMFGAGSSSTAASLAVFTLAMILYPEVMHRAQKQIDAVVGRDRMPTFEDRESLPYIEAMVKEVLRWWAVGPLGVPRCTTQDDWYKGYFIPKGTIVMYNVWAANRDPEYFPDYDTFRPERYLDSSGNLCDPIPDTHNQGHLAYGTGRRICVGKDLANQALFIDIAAMLWAFGIKQAVGAEGEPVTPSRTSCVNEGTIIRPKAFRCTITPRWPEVSSIVECAVDAFAGSS